MIARISLFMASCAMAAMATAQSVPVEREGRFNGVAVRYAVDTAPVTVTTPAGGARIVGFGYVRKLAKAERQRPVAFLFNGGPIAASLWIHLGVFGPKRVLAPIDLTQGPEAFSLGDNPMSPLDAADLVFVDPADTGFSRRAPGTLPGAFASVATDADQIAAYIRAWLANHGRSDAPVYLIGESYGTVRIPAVIEQLAKGSSPVTVDGAVLLGQAVNIVEYSQRPANVVSYGVSLPTLSAIAWYHRRIDRRGRSLAAVIAEAHRYAEEIYLPALYRGRDLPDDQRRTIAARLADLTGIPADYYRDHDLRITKEQFRVALLRDRQLLIGRNDARYIAPITDRGGAPDPSDVIVAGFDRLWAAYLRDDLKVTSDVPYIPLAEVKGLEAWNWGGSSPFSDWRYAAPVTAQFARNPRFRVIIANGIFDTQTTIGAADYLRRQSGWPAARTAYRAYGGGHMAYTDPDAARAIAADVHALLTSAPLRPGRLGEP